MSEYIVPETHREVTTPSALDREVYDCPDWCELHEITHTTVPGRIVDAGLTHTKRFLDETAPFIVNLTLFRDLVDDVPRDSTTEVVIFEQERYALECNEDPASLRLLGAALLAAADELEAAQTG